MPRGRSTAAHSRRRSCRAARAPVPAGFSSGPHSTMKPPPRPERLAPPGSVTKSRAASRTSVMRRSISSATSPTLLQPLQFGKGRVDVTDGNDAGDTRHGDHRQQQHEAGECQLADRKRERSWPSNDSAPTPLGTGPGSCRAQFIRYFGPLEHDRPPQAEPDDPAFRVARPLAQYRQSMTAGGLPRSTASGRISAIQAACRTARERAGIVIAATPTTTQPSPSHAVELNCSPRKTTPSATPIGTRK